MRQGAFNRPSPIALKSQAIVVRTVMQTVLFYCIGNDKETIMTLRPLGSLTLILMFLWFLIYGILAITNITFVAAPIILGFIALAICVCILFGR